MKQGTLSIPVFLVVLSLFAVSAFAGDQVVSETTADMGRQGLQYEDGLLTEKEIKAYRDKMQSLKTSEQLKIFRKEYKTKISELAKMHGVKQKEALMCGDWGDSCSSDSDCCSRSCGWSDSCGGKCCYP